VVYIKINNASVNIPLYDISSKRFFSLSKSAEKIKVGGNKIIKNKNLSVQALKNITLEINEGDRVGLIGHNGAGKTTFLRLIGGIYKPDKGNLDIKGSISSLMKPHEVFLEDATGYENITRMLYYYRQDLNKFETLTNEIADFSELGENLNLPIKTYSTGMLIRLSFAIATSFVPEITLIDEDFGGGDKDFYEKAQKRMNEYMDKSSILVLASHNNDIIKSYCNKCILLNKGEVVLFDETSKVIQRHYEE
jgi:ABC-type polysaccharide/polyol phosphate transport system ATPase subunit